MTQTVKNPDESGKSATQVKRAARVKGADQIGRSIRNEMFGEEATTAQLVAGDPMLERLQEIVTQTCFGETWARPELALRDRSIVTVAMLIALGREHELRTHIRGALSNGVTPNEIREIAIHSYLYAGLPAAFGGAVAASDVFTDDEKAELS